MLSHYSHIRTQAKRDALETVAKRRRKANEELRQGGQGIPNITQGFEGESLQRSLQSRSSEGHRGVVKTRKSKNLIGSSGKTRIRLRTYFQQFTAQQMARNTAFSIQRSASGTGTARSHARSLREWIPLSRGRARRFIWIMAGGLESASSIRDSSHLWRTACLAHEFAVQ
jgi:hypothetical protein